MKILILSDTHGSVKAWKEIEKFSKDADRVFHLGDVLYHGPRNPLPEGYDPKSLAGILKGFDITYVKGNCDADVDLMVLGLDDMPRIRIFEIYGWKFVMTHGDMIENVEDFLEKTKADVLLHGHTHILKVEKIGDSLVVNPGSPSLPKGGNPPSFAILDVSGSSVNVLILGMEGSVLKEGRFER